MTTDQKNDAKLERERLAAHRGAQDPNTDDYAQFVGRMAQELREALAPHFVAASLLGKVAAKVRGETPISVDVAESISFAWGARSSHAKLLAPPHELAKESTSILAKVTRGKALTLTEAQALKYGQAWAGEARTFRGLRPRFVHCTSCLLPVTPSRSRFAFSNAAVSEEQMTDACSKFKTQVRKEYACEVTA